MAAFYIEVNAPVLILNIGFADITDATQGL